MQVQQQMFQRTHDSVKDPSANIAVLDNPVAYQQDPIKGFQRSSAPQRPTIYIYTNPDTPALNQLAARLAHLPDTASAASALHVAASLAGFGCQMTALARFVSMT